MGQATTTRDCELLKYIRTIRNGAKRAYAESYAALGDSAVIPIYAMSHLAAQCVRLRVDDIRRRQAAG